MESDGLVERRNDPADRRARCLYLKPKAKPVVDDIWHLVELTRREAFAGIPKRQTDLLISLLEKIQSNFASLQPLPAPSSPSTPHNARAGVETGSARIRRDRTVPQS